jgi:DNA-binding PadR family transcriptional regulator
MNSYRAYGLRIVSEIFIPEFPEYSFESPDLAIHSVALDEAAVNFPQETPYYLAQEGNTFIKIPSIGIFSVCQGNEIRVGLVDGEMQDRLHLYLSGNIFGFLLHQRGYLVLHASAACVAGQAAAFLGTPGAGKSSMVAALHQIGHTILVDDVTAVDLRSDPASVIPGFPQIKLDIEAAQSLRIDPQSLIYLDKDEQKRGFRFAERFLDSEQPLSKIYILTDEGDQTFQRIPSQEAILELIRNSYPTRFAQAGGAGHFLQCAELVKRVPIYRLKRPSTLRDLPDFAVLLADHILSIPA